MSSLRLGGVLVVLAVFGLGAAQSDDQDQPKVSEISDPRIVEASGMALSTRVAGVGYVVNDSGNDPVVFGVEVATGKVVGTTTLTGVDVVDAEALAVTADGRLVVADIGDNAESRDEVALLFLPQPGTGATTVAPTVQRVRYAGGPVDAEALVADPSTGRLVIATKQVFGGQVLTLPAHLPTDEVVVAQPLDVTTPGLVTDGAALPDGRGVVLRTYTEAFVYALPDWRLTGQLPLPQTRQGETLVVEAGGRSVLTGSEGLPSPILRVQLPADALRQLAAPAGDHPPAVGRDLDPPAQAVYGPYYAVGGVTVALLGAVVLIRRWRSTG